METITVGLPVFNSEKFLEDCINSVLNQTYTDFILLIVDDGSTDDSIRIVKGFRDERIQLIVDGENRGLPYRLNQIANLCNTKYLLRMDSDDIMHIDRIRTQINLMEQHPNIDVLGTNAYVIDSKNNITGVRNSILLKGKNDLKKTAKFIHPSIIGKTSWFIKHPYNERLLRAQDTELWLRTKSISNFKSTVEPLMFYREFGTSYYKKYWKNLGGKGRILCGLLKQNQMVLSFRYFIREYIRTLCMAIIYTFLSLLNAEDLLIKRRSSSLTSADQDVAKRALEEAIRYNN